MSSYQQKQKQVSNLLNSLPYKKKSDVEVQILQLLHQINSIRPTVDNYCFNNGTIQQLFKLDGTIPIHYRGNQYNIPIAFWLPISFPVTCPICYVVPVHGMKIKDKHKHVDAQGLIYHPYLHEWKYGKSTFVDLVGLLCSEFGKNPPLFAVKNKNKQQQTKKPNYNNNAYNNQQNNYNRNNNNQMMQQQQQPQPQPRQMYSNNNNNNYMNQNNYNNNFNSNNNMNYNNNNQMSSYGQPIQQNRNNNSMNNNMSINQNNNMNPNGMNNINNNNSNNNNINNNPQNIKMEVDKKLRIDLQQIYDRENEQLSTLGSKRKQLETRSTQMDDILTQLDNEKNLLCERKNKLELKIKELELWLSKNETNDEFDIDKVIIPSDTWSKQCMDAVSNDYAITDTMLELDKCIEDEVIKLDPYLKQLRKLGRQQFTHKALAKAVFNKQDEMVKRRANNVY